MANPLSFLSGSEGRVINKTERFMTLGSYEDYIKSNPFIEIVSVMSYDGYIVLTYRSAN